MHNKRKILFVVAEFWQGGAQRHTYEIYKALNKEKFDITILSLRDLGSSAEWKDYYYKHYIDQNTPVCFYNQVNHKQGYSILDRLKRKLFNVELLPENWPIITFLNQFEKLVFFGEYTFPFVEKFVGDELRSKCYICVVNSIFQVPENYDKYNKTQKYQFISGFINLNEEFQGFSNFNHDYFPLSISFKGENRMWSQKPKKQKIIGVYTRLTKNKPLDVFLFALHLMRLEGLDVILNVYGNGNPAELGILNNIEALSLTQYVIFKGHQENLVNSALNEELDVVWAHSYYGFPGGFASMDLSSIGIPQVFWNFTPNCESEEYNEFNVFKDINKFVEYNKQLLKDSSFAQMIGEKQYVSIKSNNNIDENIKILEEIFS